MIYPVNIIAVTQYHHRGKAIDFGWGKEHHQWIIATDDGTIIKIEKQKTGGNVIYLKHKTGIVSVYGHLEDIIVKKNQKVIKGEHIARMGNSGISTGEHLHYEMHSKGSNMYGKADMDPMKFLQVDKNQQVLNTPNNKKLKDKFLYVPDNQNFEVARSYRLLNEKAIRTTPELIDNIVKVKDTKKSIRKDLTSKKPNDKAYFKVGTDIFTTKIVEDDNRIWGRLENCYIVLQNQDGTKQCEKLRGIN